MPTDDERKEIIERIKYEELGLTDFIAEQIAGGDWTSQEKLFRFLAGWLTRQRELIRDGERTPYKVAIDISEGLDYYGTKEEVNKFKNELRSQAIHEGWDIIK